MIPYLAVVSIDSIDILHHLWNRVDTGIPNNLVLGVGRLAIAEASPRDVSRAPRSERGRGQRPHGRTGHAHDQSGPRV